MVCNYCQEGCNDGANHGTPKEESVLGGVDRRSFLKRASGAGAGFGFLKNQVDQATPNGRIRFGTVGIRYRIEDDVDAEFIDDCAHPKWEIIDGELVFYSYYLSNAERARLAGGRTIVSAKDIHHLPAGAVSLAKSFYLPTNLGKGLQPRERVLYDGAHSLPTPRITTVGGDIEVEFDGTRQRVTPGEDGVLELDATAVGLRQQEKRVTRGEAAEGEANVVYESNVVETTLTPEVQIRNHGEMAFYTVDDKLEVN